MEHCKKFLRTWPGNNACGKPATRWFWARSGALGLADYIICRCEEHAKDTLRTAVEIRKAEAEVLIVMRS